MSHALCLYSPLAFSFAVDLTDGDSGCNVHADDPSVLEGIRRAASAQLLISAGSNFASDDIMQATACVAPQPTPAESQSLRDFVLAGGCYRIWFERNDGTLISPKSGLEQNNEVSDTRLQEAVSAAVLWARRAAAAEAALRKAGLPVPEFEQ